MTVVVVNCSAWPTFPNLVRTRALDLYRPDQRVEFWHAAATQGDEAELRIWGNWPKWFGEPLWLLVDELWDLVTTHATAVSEVSNVDDRNPLTLIVVMDVGATPQRRPAARLASASAAVMKAMNALAHRISDDTEHEVEIRRSVWRVAVLRTRGAGPRPSAQTLAATAWNLVTSPARPTEQNPAVPPEIFDTAIVIDGAPPGNADEGNFAALRMVIDIARDARSREALKPIAARTEQKVIKLTVPRVRWNPSDRILSDLAMLAQEYEKTPVRDDSAHPLDKLIGELKDRTFLTDENRLSEVVTEDGRPPDNDSIIDGVLLEYFPSAPPSLSDLTDRIDIDSSAAVLTAAEAKLQPFLSDRNETLRKMRRDQDNQVRYYENLLKEIETNAADRAFGQTGQTLHAIENGSKTIRNVQDDFISRAGKSRERLDEEYRQQSEPARAANRAGPLLSDFAEFSTFKEEKGRLVDRLANAANSRRFVLGWLTLSSFYALLVIIVLCFARRGPVWAWSTVRFILMVAVGTVGAGIWLFIEWRRRQKQQMQAVTAVLQAYAAVVDRIDRVTRLALAHVASSRIAGRLEPFTRLLFYRWRDLLELREATGRVFAAIRAEKDRISPNAQAVVAPQPYAFESKLKEAAAQDSLKIVLGEFEASATNDVDITFKEGEMSGGLVLATALVLEPPLELTFLRRPVQPTSPNAKPPGKPPPKGPQPDAPTE
jgi:hypothetical protein